MNDFLRAMGKNAPGYGRNVYRTLMEKYRKKSGVEQVFLITRMTFEYIHKLSRHLEVFQRTISEGARVLRSRTVEGTVSEELLPLDADFLNDMAEKIVWADAYGFVRAEFLFGIVVARVVSSDAGRTARQSAWRPGQRMMHEPRLMDPGSFDLLVIKYTTRPTEYRVFTGRLSTSTPTKPKLVPRDDVLVMVTRSPDFYGASGYAHPSSPVLQMEREVLAYRELHETFLSVARQHAHPTIPVQVNPEQGAQLVEVLSRNAQGGSGGASGSGMVRNMMSAAERDRTRDDRMEFLLLSMVDHVSTMQHFAGQVRTNMQQTDRGGLGNPESDMLTEDMERRLQYMPMGVQAVTGVPRSEYPPDMMAWYRMLYQRQLDILHSEQDVGASTTNTSGASSATVLSDLMRMRRSRDRTEDIVHMMERWLNMFWNHLYRDIHQKHYCMLILAERIAEVGDGRPADTFLRSLRKPELDVLREHGALVRRVPRIVVPEVHAANAAASAPEDAAEPAWTVRPVTRGEFVDLLEQGTAGDSDSDSDTEDAVAAYRAHRPGQYTLDGERVNIHNLRPSELRVIDASARVTFHLQKNPLSSALVIDLHERNTLKPQFVPTLLSAATGIPVHMLNTPEAMDSGGGGGGGGPNGTTSGDTDKGPRATQPGDVATKRADDAEEAADRIEDEVNNRTKPAPNKKKPSGGGSQKRTASWQDASESESESPPTKRKKASKSSSNVTKS